MRNPFRAWIKIFFVFVCSACAVVCLVTFIVDPLWFFAHSNRFNSRQLPFNECQQKSNYLVHRNNSFDALVLGSSRMTSFHQQDVVGYQAFNNAISGTLSPELGEYVEFAKRHNSRPFKLIIIGLDFFSTNANFKGFGSREIRTVFANAESPWYRAKYLMTLDALRFSIRNLRLYFGLSDGKPYYDRHNTLTVPVLSRDARDASLRRDLATFQNDFYGQSYRYRDLSKTFRELVAQNPDSRFIVFATPESLPAWQVMIIMILMDHQHRGCRVRHYPTLLDGMIDHPIIPP